MKIFLIIAKGDSLQYHSCLFISMMRCMCIPSHYYYTVYTVGLIYIMLLKNVRMELSFFFVFILKFALHSRALLSFCNRCAVIQNLWNCSNRRLSHYFFQPYRGHSLCQPTCFKLYWRDQSINSLINHDRFNISGLTLTFFKVQTKVMKLTIKRQRPQLCNVINLLYIYWDEISKLCAIVSYPISYSRDNELDTIHTIVRTIHLF